MTEIFTDCLEIECGSLKDYNTLARYHYRTEPIKPVTQIYKVVGRKPHRSAFPDPIAVIVYRMPIPDLRPRTSATKGYFHKPKSLSERLKLANEKIQYIARLIVDPRFHKMGIASWLLKDSLDRQTVPLIETRTPIDFTNKLFQKAGFKLYRTSAPRWYRQLSDALIRLGLTEESLRIPWFVNNRLKHLSSAQQETIETTIKRFMSHFRHRRDMSPDMKRTEFICSKLQYPEAYLLWQNPRTPKYNEN